MGTASLRILPNYREALMKLARADSEGVYYQTRYGKCGNTVRISHFLYRSLGTKDPLLSRRSFHRSFPEKKEGIIYEYRFARLRRGRPGRL